MDFERSIDKMKNIIFIVLSLLLTGCITSSKVTKFLNNNPNVAAEYCADMYPVKTEYIRGKNDTTIVVKREIVKVPVKVGGDTVFIDCPENEIIYKYIRNTDTLIRENTALAEMYRIKSNTWEEKYNSSNKDAQVSQRKANNRLWTVVIMGVVMALLFFVLFKK